MLPYDQQKALASKLIWAIQAGLVHVHDEGRAYILDIPGNTQGMSVVLTLRETGTHSGGYYNEEKVFDDSFSTEIAYVCEDWLAESSKSYEETLIEAIEGL